MIVVARNAPRLVGSVARNLQDYFRTSMLEDSRLRQADGLKAAAADSRLGWEPSMEYLGDAEHIRWKIAHL